MNYKRDLKRRKPCTNIEDLFPYLCTWSTKTDKQTNCKKTNYKKHLKKIKATESNYTKVLKEET